MSHERNEHVDRAWSLGAGTMSRPQRGLFAGLVVVAVVAVAGVAGAVPAADHGSFLNPLDEIGDVTNTTDDLGIWGGGVRDWSSGSNPDFLRNDTVHNWGDGGGEIPSDFTLTFVVKMNKTNTSQQTAPRWLEAQEDNPQGPTDSTRWFSIQPNQLSGDTFRLGFHMTPCGESSLQGNLQGFSGDGTHHYAITVDSDEANNDVSLEAFENGTQVGSANFDSSLCTDLDFYDSTDANGGFAVGGEHSGGSSAPHPSTEFYDVRFFDQVLPTQEIQDLADANGTIEHGEESNLWTFGDNITGSLQLPLSPDAEFSLSSPGRGIGVTHAPTTNAEVYVRTNPGSGIDGGKIVRFDEALAVQNRILGCDGPGLRNVTGSHGLTVSWDNLVAARCVTAGNDPVLAVYDSVEMLDTVRFQPGNDGATPPVHMESNTLNRIVFDDGDSVDFYGADVPDESVVRRTFGDSATFSQVAIDRDPSNNVSWVAGQNDQGTFVASSMGGVKLVDNSTFTQGVVQLFNRTLWTADAQDTIFKLEVVNASSLEEVRTASTDLNVEAGLWVSMDGGYLLEQTSSSGTDAVNLRDAGNLSVLRTLGTDGDVEDVAMDRCNNFAYVVTGGSSPVVQRFDVSGETDTSAGGNGTTGLNPCPDNPFTADTQGSIADGKSAVEEEPDGFASQLKAKAATQFGMTENNAGFFLGGLFLLGFALIGAQGVSRVGGQAKWGAGIGLGAGLAFTLAMDLIPLWFVLVMALVAAAVVVFRR